MDKTSTEYTIQGMALAKKAAELTDEMINPDGTVNHYAAEQAVHAFTKACECSQKAKAIAAMKSSK